MPLPPPPAAGLTRSGIADPSAAAAQRRVRLVGVVVARRRPARRARPRAVARRPCRPSPGSRPAAARPSAMPGGDRPPRRSRRSRRGSRSPGGPRRRRRRARPRRPPSMSSRSSRAGAVRSAARPPRIPRRSQVRGSGRDLAAVGDEQVRIGVTGRWRSRVAMPSATTNASIASDATRHRPPTRLAGSRPLAIQRWTERVVAPIRARGLAWAQFLGHACRDCRISSRARRRHCPSSGLVLGRPCRAALLGERAEAFLRLLARRAGAR